MSVFDKTEMFISTDKGQKIASSTSIWTNNRLFLDIWEDYFSIKWRQAKCQKHPSQINGLEPISDILLKEGLK
jgi:hypothetical protein